MLALVRNITRQKRAEAALKQVSADLVKAYDATLQGWSHALELREHETAGHSRRAVQMTIRLARALGISQDQLVHIQRGALLHDIGHLLHDLPDDVADNGIDTQHESTGSAWLSQYFDLAVTEPVRMHVAAKRYLAFMEPGYFDKLSDASKLSLRLQGGPMSHAQAAAFEAGPFFADAIRLRRWDEEAKIVGYTGPALAYFEAQVAASLAQTA